MSLFGAVALVGSGEYTDAMNTTDQWLMDTLDGVKEAKVALLPTASGLEGDRPHYWNNLGIAHFRKLGVSDIRATMITDSASAHDPQQLDLLRGANFFYLSGGNPNHTIQSLRNSPAWDIISQAYAHGAVVAGCSAGAMTMSSYTVSIRIALSSGPISWVPAISVVPNIIVLPHFDRMLGRLSRAVLQSRFVAIPAGHVVAGIDEDTALVRIALPDDNQPARWRVMGRQSVTIFASHQEPKIYPSGSEIIL
jgi:cyanophycinase